MRKSISKFFVSALFIVVGIFFIFNACKKDRILKDPIASAKDWYLKSETNKGTVLQSNKGTSQQIKQEVDWNTARTFQLDDGTDVIGVSVKMKLGKSELGGSYMLLIHKSKNSYQVQVAYNPEKGFFEGYMSDRGMIALYKQTLNVNNKKPLGGVNKNKLMALPVPAGILLLPITMVMAILLAPPLSFFTPVVVAIWATTLSQITVGL